ncbi:hypothetical protein [Chryseobacterium sp. EO14]|uniref:hypothetical protein n=1 Tax=Chryseobacterium sp. EO14 TaxID=2950551 RepID=UPI00210D60ED|nr:hypothetical protein [Chryseobacterium sp. EO14]MCQ4141754.1 hypothetical protein [Chryseobacterium sp. EO14]
MELTINHTTKKFEKLPENLEALLAMELPEKKKGIAVARISIKIWGLSKKFS